MAFNLGHVADSASSERNNTRQSDGGNCAVCLETAEKLIVENDSFRFGIVIAPKIDAGRDYVPGRESRIHVLSSN